MPHQTVMKWMNRKHAHMHTCIRREEHAMMDDEGNEHPCAFYSATLNPAKQNYQVYNRELLAIIRALEQW